MYTRRKRIGVDELNHGVIKWVVASMIFIATLTFTVWDLGNEDMDTTNQITAESKR